VPELAFFIGKGGVGKTTVSAAYAVYRARQISSGRVLLVSTDPAHSLADVLQRKLRRSKTEILLRSRGKLTAREVDSASLFRSFLDQHKRELIQTIERGSLFTAEEISSLLETTLPGMSEIAALLAIQEAIESGEYSNIVVDTAPFGHTLRLFGLPEQFLRLLNFLDLSADRDRVLAEHFGGTTQRRTGDFVSDWRSKIGDLQAAFAKANLFLVTTPERFALNESVRCMQELRASNPELALRAIVLNRIVRQKRVGQKSACPNCRRRSQATRSATAQLRKDFKSAKLYIGEDPGAPVLGIEGLRSFGSHVFEGKPLKLNSVAPKTKTRTGLQFTPAAWPKLTAPLTFVIGKGGVGKTTVSASLGYCARARAPEPVEICSVDPAPSLDDIFQTPVDDRPTSVLGDPGFKASELDSLALFKNWVQEIRSEVQSATSAQYSGLHVDLSYERKLFTELLEIVPPGLDEVLAIFRIVELLGPARKVIIDMAPTGHALELLRMPERILVWARLLLKSLAAHRKLALAREAAVKIAELEVRARELAAILRSSRKSQIFSVMLPEPLPDRETARLLDEMAGLRLPVNAIFVNRVLWREQAGECQRCSRAVEWQAAILANLRKRYRDKAIFAVRNFDHEISGKRGLQQMTNELWRLN
jgi:arsenite-transporting ATPase